MTVQPEREAFVPRVVDDADAENAVAIDRKAVELRGAGKSYGTIARSLGLESPRSAHEAFSRGVRQRPAGERAKLRQAESLRLDALADKTKARTDLSSDQRSKRLRSIERLRQTVMMD